MIFNSKKYMNRISTFYEIAKDITKNILGKSFI